MVEFSKKGLSCIWEKGGATTASGHSRVIANKGGFPKKPLFLRKSGHLSNGEHALLPILIGDYIIKTSQGRKSLESVEVLKITSLPSKIDGKEVGELKTELSYEFSQGEWSNPLPSFLERAVNAGFRKACDYHCRVPYFIWEGEPMNSEDFLSITHNN